MYEVSEKQKCFENNVISSTCHRNASKALCFCTFGNTVNMRWIVKILNKNPRYDVAFFFKCNLNIAAHRRWKDLKTLNKQITFREVKKSLKKRNSLDMKRRFSPLIRAKDSIIIRTDVLSKKAMIAKMSKEIEKKLILKYGRNIKTR